MGGALLPAFWPSGGSRPIKPRTACAANLSSIGRSCLLYAEGAQGVLPPSLDVLTYGGRYAYVQPKQLGCPACGGTYIYVPGYTNRDDPTGVLAYEPLSYHGGKGANVLRLDGSVKWVAPKDHEQAMNQVEDHLLTISARPIAPRDRTTPAP
jgi:prepilin-type processing-associated H-X9-DG protein